MNPNINQHAKKEIITYDEGKKNQSIETNPVLTPMSELAKILKIIVTVFHKFHIFKKFSRDIKDIIKKFQIKL